MRFFLPFLCVVLSVCSQLCHGSSDQTGTHHETTKHDSGPDTSRGTEETFSKEDIKSHGADGVSIFSDRVGYGGNQDDFGEMDKYEDFDDISVFGTVHGGSGDVEKGDIETVVSDKDSNSILSFVNWFSWNTEENNKAKGKNEDNFLDIPTSSDESKQLNHDLQSGLNLNPNPTEPFIIQDSPQDSRFLIPTDSVEIKKLYQMKSSQHDLDLSSEYQKDKSEVAPNKQDSSNHKNVLQHHLSDSIQPVAFLEKPLQNDDLAVHMRSKRATVGCAVKKIEGFWNDWCEYICPESNQVLPSTLEKGYGFYMPPNSKECVYSKIQDPSGSFCKLDIYEGDCSIQCSKGATLPFTIPKGCSLKVNNKTSKCDVVCPNTTVGDDSNVVPSTSLGGGSNVVRSTTVEAGQENTRYLHLHSSHKDNPVTLTSSTETTPTDTSVSRADETSLFTEDYEGSGDLGLEDNTTPTKSDDVTSSKTTVETTRTNDVGFDDATSTSLPHQDEKYPSSSTQAVINKDNVSSSTYIEKDIDTSKYAVYHLKSKYSTCDNCMVNLHPGPTECPYYKNRALQFDKMSAEYSDMLKYGCHAQGITNGSRCCHAPDQIVVDTINQMTVLAETLSERLKKQCDKCPVDCQWHAWGDWSVCPIDTCEGQNIPRQIRKRTFEKAKYSGKHCSGISEEERNCPFVKRVIGKWQHWTSWSECSDPCVGTRTRTRTCTNATVCFTPCRGDSMDAENCGDPAKCCKDPVWSKWGAWEECLEVIPGMTRSSKMTQKRHRICQPDPAYPRALTCANKKCQGRDEQERDCEEKCNKCVPRVWTQWGAWESCQDRTLNNMANGNGTTSWERFKIKRRRCEADPKYPKEPMCPDNCPGYGVDTDPCCTLSSWSSWTPWSPCSGKDGVTDLDTGEPCGSGLGCQSRNRTCIYGTCNDECPGNKDDTINNCTLKLCCAPPKLSEWGHWEECTVGDRYGRSVQRRRRHCQADPQKWAYPTCRTVDCANGQKTIDVKNCQKEECSQCVPREWTDWGHWGACFHSDPGVIGGGIDEVNLNRIKIRRRQCEVNPSYPKETMCPEPCKGDDSETTECCTLSIWSTWGSWGPCKSKDGENYKDKDTGEPCGYGLGCQSRTRNCSKGTCENSTCLGNAVDNNNNCTLKLCCQPPIKTEWGDWGQCRHASQSRTRYCLTNPEKSSYPTCQRHPYCRLGRESETQRCQLENCTTCEPPSWREWTTWTPCISDESYSTRTRTRTCYNPSSNRAECRAAGCDGSDLEREKCDCEPPNWREWTAWTPCMSDGSYSTRTRTRTCYNPSINRAECREAGCDGSDSQRETCDCAPRLWSKWSDWDACRSTRLAYNGKRGQIQTRTRSCLQPKMNPDYCINIPYCQGKSFDEKTCCEEPTWLAWTSWSRCDFRQRSSLRMRTRKCNNPSAGNQICAQNNCHGSDTESDRCLCDRASWGSWLSWSTCEYESAWNSKGSRSNAAGVLLQTHRIRKRLRLCHQAKNNPAYCARDAPKEWMICTGRDYEDESCCDPESQWSMWSVWTPCQMTNNGPRTHRYRDCQWLPGCKPFRDNKGPVCTSGSNVDWQTCFKPTSTTPAVIPTTPSIATTECFGRAQGYYALRGSRCRQYINCCEDGGKNVTCSEGQVFDSYCGTCHLVSSSCNENTNYEDINVDSTNSMRTKRKNKEYCKCLNKIQTGMSSAPLQIKRMYSENCSMTHLSGRHHHDTRRHQQDSRRHPQARIRDQHNRRRHHRQDSRRYPNSIHKY